MRENFYISFSIWLCLLSFLGVPIVWKTSLVFASGLFLLLINIGPIIFNNIKPKVRTRRKPSRTQASSSVQKSDIEFKNKIPTIYLDEEKEEELHVSK